MGPALMNNCNTARRKRYRNGYNQGDLNEKRRCLRSNNFVPKSSTSLHYKNSSTIDLGSSSEDENQNMFLKISGEKIDARSLEDDMDLGYKMFLEHVREDGKSYVLEMVNAHDGKPVCVKYEGDDMSSDEREIPIKSKSNEDEPQNQMDSDNISNKGRSTGSGKNQKSHTSGLACHGKNRSSCDKSGQLSLRSSSPDDNQKNESLVDESYQTFLNHVRVHGDSLVLELENGFVLEYEEEVRTTSSREDEDVLSDGGELPTKRISDEEESQDKGNSDIILSKRTYLGKKKQKLQMLGLISNGKNKSASDESGQIILRSLSPDHNQENKSLVDESYQTFLNHVTMHGDSLVLELGNDVVVKYEEDDEGFTASKGSSAETTLCFSEMELESHRTSQQHSDSFACEDGVNSLESLWCSNQFQFKDELMACLDKPFDQKEHDMLLNEAKTQKRLERRRDLRSRSVSYATGRRSMSYFDHYPELERQIKYAAATPHRSLTLLRGFFFWLKNLSHEGAFPPWKALPTDDVIFPVSTNQMATPVQIEIPEGVKEESDILPIELEMSEGVKEETDIYPIQIEMPNGTKEVTDILPVEIEVLEGVEGSEIQPIEIST